VGKRGHTPMVNRFGALNKGHKYFIGRRERERGNSYSNVRPLLREAGRKIRPRRKEHRGCGRGGGKSFLKSFIGEKRNCPRVSPKRPRKERKKGKRWGLFNSLITQGGKN